MLHIDINCDMGEGIGNDHLLMPYISSCSIACGGHTGTEKSILETISLADQYKVKIGAHPSYPDPENFGRKSIEISNSDFTNSIKKQISLFVLCCKKNNSKIHHVKPHGALYNDLYFNHVLVLLFLDVIKELIPKVIIYCAPGSVLEKEAKRIGFATIREGFMDRAYNSDGTLRDRKLMDSVLIDKNQVKNQVVRFVKESRVLSYEENLISMPIDTLCLHGDHPNALQLIQFVNQSLKSEGIDVY